MSYKRQKVLSALLRRGFSIIREGASHTIVGSTDGRAEPVPRHREINRFTTRKIAKNLGIPWQDFENDIR